MVKGDASDGTVTASPPLWVESPRPLGYARAKDEGKNAPMPPPQAQEKRRAVFLLPIQGETSFSDSGCAGARGAARPPDGAKGR